MKRAAARKKSKIGILYILIIFACLFAVGKLSLQSARAYQYVIKYGNETYKVSSPSSNTADILADCGIAVDDISYSESRDGDTINVSVNDTYTVAVSYDGVSSFLTTKKDTVKSVLDTLGVHLNIDDEVSCPLDEYVCNDMEISITRKNISYETVETEIAYETKYVENPELEEGIQNVKTEGSAGLQITMYRRTDTDGECSDFDLISDSVAKEPVDEVIEIGTKKAPAPEPEPEPVKKETTESSQSKSTARETKPAETATSSSAPSESTTKETKSSEPSYSSNSSTSASGGTITTSSGETYSYSDVIEMTATAYTYSGNEQDITSSGMRVAVGIVAVPRGTIPAGTRVFIKSIYDGSWEYGVAVVGDTCGSNVIDLFMESYDECIQFGVRSALVYILD